MVTTITLSLLGVALVILLAMSYVKAPPDIAYVISGLKKRVIVGKASLRIPFLERLDKISLRLIPIDVKTSTSVPTKDYINVNVDSVVNIKVSNDPEKLKLAAQNFLNRDSDYIAKVAREVLEGNMREIVGQMHLEEMVTDRQLFAEKVKENAGPDLSAMGLEIVSFNVQNFVDGDKVIENLGIDNIVKISKTAAIARANAERDIAVAKAQAEKESNDAAVAAATEIAKKQTDLAIKKAELKKDADTQIAIAEAAHGIMTEEQRKIKEIKSGDANIARQEKEIELKERAVSIKERELDATVKKQADADKYALEKQSDARLYALQKDAEADLIKRSKNAEAERVEAEQKALAIKAVAEADKIKGENEAKVIAAKGEAEASAIKLKALAEAEGIEKRAIALQKLNDAGKMEMQLKVATSYVEQLPAIAKGIAEAYSKVGNITMYGDQSGKIASAVIDKTAQLSDGLAKGLGIDLKSMVMGALGIKALTNSNAQDSSVDVSVKR